MSDEVKELAIGEIGEIDGMKVKCVEADQTPPVYVCNDCVFNNNPCTRETPLDSARCSPSERTDGLYVTFKEATE